MKPLWRGGPTSVRLVLYAVSALLLLWFLLWFPEWMTNQYRWPLDDAKDYAAQVSANRATLVNILGGIAVAITIYFTYRNFQVTQDKALSETFSKAVEELGSDKASVRLGGVHTLARIGKTSESDYFPAIQVLTGYLSETYKNPLAPVTLTSPGTSQCPVDAQAILTIVGERYWPDPDGYRIDLSFINLQDAWLPSANLSNIYCWYACLRRASFEDANLSGVDFRGTRFEDCTFTDANFTGADLTETVFVNHMGLTKSQLRKARNVPLGLLESLA